MVTSVEIILDLAHGNHEYHYTQGEYLNEVFKESEKQILNNNLHILLISQMKCCSCFHANENNNF